MNLSSSSYTICSQRHDYLLVSLLDCLLEDWSSNPCHICKGFCAVCTKCTIMIPLTIHTVSGKLRLNSKIIIWHSMQSLGTGPRQDWALSRCLKALVSDWYRQLGSFR